MNLISVDTSLQRIVMAATIVSALDGGPVYFTFVKKTTGKTRNASGTRKKELYNYSFRGGSAPSKPGLFRYWDFEKTAWRSFYIDRVLRWRIDYSFEQPANVEVLKPEPIKVDELKPVEKEVLTLPVPENAGVVLPKPPAPISVGGGGLLLKPTIKIVIEFK